MTGPYWVLRHALRGRSSAGTASQSAPTSTGDRTLLHRSAACEGCCDQRAVTRCSPFEGSSVHPAPSPHFTFRCRCYESRVSRRYHTENTADGPSRLPSLQPILVNSRAERAHPRDHVVESDPMTNTTNIGKQLVRLENDCAGRRCDPLTESDPNHRGKINGNDSNGRRGRDGPPAALHH